MSDHPHKPLSIAEVTAMNRTVGPRTDEIEEAAIRMMENFGQPDPSTILWRDDSECGSVPESEE